MLSSLTRLPRYAKTLLVLLVDCLLAAVALWGAMVARAGGIPNMSEGHAVVVTAFVMLLAVVAALSCGMYRSVIRFQPATLPLRAAAVALVCALVIGLVGWIGGARNMAFGLGAVFGLALFFSLLLSRYTARWLLNRRAVEAVPVAVYGAGEAGRQLVAVMRQGHDYTPVLFIDDDASLHGRMVEDIVVIGSHDKKFAHRLASKAVREVFLAIPSLKPSRRREILELLGELPYRVRSVPGIAELMRGHREAIGNLKEVAVEDLLGRDLVPPLPGLMEKCVKGLSVLVSGGGGSIGAELCRQVLALAPQRLIVLDHSEIALYRIEQELRQLQGESGVMPELRFVLGSVNEMATLQNIFASYRVDTVYHAAAYKHVPMVEDNPVQGLCNNVLGTRRLAEAAARAKASYFTLVSTDKAVRPTNVMGATKRMAELAIQVLAERHSGTVFSIVRFGNVLDSSGSVVPLFRNQIERGGPITLTHPDVTRYFMTIEEAVQLVIQAGAMARGGEVFLLDMGEPRSIMDLALKMIRLSGRSVRDRENPYGDIAVEIVGLRPGEKLYEELLIDGAAAATAHPRIWQAREAGVTASAFEAQLEELESAHARGLLEPLAVRTVLEKWVAGYKPDSRISAPYPVASATAAIGDPAIASQRA